MRMIQMPWLAYLLLIFARVHARQCTIRMASVLLHLLWELIGLVAEPDIGA
jgi:hypothetical protein